MYKKNIKQISDNTTIQLAKVYFFSSYLRFLFRLNIRFTFYILLFRVGVVNHFSLEKVNIFCHS